MSTDTNPLPLGVIVVAAGSGQRLGAGAPKAFTDFAHIPLIEHSVRTVTTINSPGQLVLVVPATHVEVAGDIASRSNRQPHLWQIDVVLGGNERHESVRFGLAELHQQTKIVLIHDAARPLTPQSIFEQVAHEVDRLQCGIIPVLPVVDTLKRIDAHGAIIETVDRAATVAVQTPQGFLLSQLREAYSALKDGPTSSTQGALPTDDAEVLQRAGGMVKTVPGSAYSHKLTTPVDQLFLTGLLQGEHT